MDDSDQPTLDQIEERFVELVAGRLSRDEADRWAARWVLADGLVWDELSWWALNLLHGIDLPAGGSGGHLHDDAQVRAWLAELRATSRSAARRPADDRRLSAAVGRADAD
ncbi:hypothetical protein ACWGN5_16530 [Streptomyces sp. NPDC055815]